MVDSWECATRWKLHFHPFNSVHTVSHEKILLLITKREWFSCKLWFNIKKNTYSLTSWGVSACLKLLATSQSRNLKSLLIGWKIKSIKAAKWAKLAVFLLIMSHLNVKSECESLLTTDDSNKPDYEYCNLHT